MKSLKERKIADEISIEELIKRADKDIYSFDFSVRNIDCPDCAAKAENAVSQQKGVKSAQLDFFNKTLNIEVDNGEDREAVIKSAFSAAKKAHPDMELTPSSKSADKEERDADHDSEGIEKSMIIRLILSAILFGIGFFFKEESLPSLLINSAAYIIIGGDVLLKAIKNIIKGKVFDENFLMSIATIGAFSIASYREAVAVMLFYQVGELFQDLSVSKSRKSIKSLMALKPDYANLLVDEKEVIADPQDIEIGSLIVIKPGERVPIDGTVVKGDSLVDTSALTGESVPREVSAGDEVLSGTINLNSVLILKTVRKFSDSAVSRILELVESAGKKKAKSEKFITRFAKYYTPIVVFLALGLAVIPPLVTGAGFGGWINRALVFLVVSCPCALVLSVPLAFFGGIGKASRSGILVKGSEILEKLKDVDTVVFDKTGTLTHGEFSVSEISPASGFEKEEIRKFAAYAESFSSHPIAVSILKAYDAEPDRSLISDYKEIAGYGISANVDGRSILVGKKDLLLQNNIEVNEAQHPANTIIYVAVDNVFAGTISISDRIKSDSKLVVPNLKALGVSKVAMLTGDNIETANRVAEELNIDRTEAGLLPQDKVNAVERLKSEIGSKGSLVFVGDGINDSPVLALADVGVAMGGLGSDAAIEAADAVIMTDEPSRLVSAIKIARKTNRIVIENIVLSLGVKGLILILAALNLASMWIAVFGDVGVAVLAVLNSVRIINSRK